MYYPHHSYIVWYLEIPALSCSQYSYWFVFGAFSCNSTIQAVILLFYLITFANLIVILAKPWGKLT
jgi:uncharacterized protein YjfI (DUF2170 family)